MGLEHPQHRLVQRILFVRPLAAPEVSRRVVRADRHHVAPGARLESRHRRHRHLEPRRGGDLAVLRRVECALEIRRCPAPSASGRASGNGVAFERAEDRRPLKARLIFRRDAARADRARPFARVIGGSSTGSTSAVKVRFGSMAAMTVVAASSSPLSSTTPVARPSAAENPRDARTGADRGAGSFGDFGDRIGQSARAALHGDAAADRIRIVGDPLQAACRRCRRTADRRDCRRSACAAIAARSSSLLEPLGGQIGDRHRHPAERRARDRGGPARERPAPAADEPPPVACGGVVD